MTVLIVHIGVSSMEVTAILCNHAEAVNNLLYLSGGGIDRVNVPPGAPPPWNVSLAIAINLRVPWTQTNQDHTLTVDLVDADGQAVSVPTGPNESQPFHAELHFNVGRPAGLEVGDSQSVSAAINIPGLPLTKLGMYQFTVAVDGTEMERLDYRAVTLPGMTFGTGAAELPKF
jgi:hypothetical protein